MANILLLDSSDVAGRAMHGILTHANHRCAAVTGSAEAWRFIREHVQVDLLFLELKLKGENGLTFIQRLRGDVFLKHLPVVIYTSVGDQPVVKAALALKIQNYLIKPYHEELVYTEIAKAGANPWRNLHFEEEKSFCAQMNIAPQDLRGMRQDLLPAVDGLREMWTAMADDLQHPEVFAQISDLAEKAEAAGVWVAVEYLEELRGRLETGAWAELKKSPDDLGYVRRLIFCQLNPGHVPEGFLSDQERKEQQGTQERDRWVRTDVTLNGPMAKQAEVEQQIDALSGCPVIGTVAAQFQMTADGRASSLNRVMDLVAQDPGLSAQILIAANRLERDMPSPIEDPRVAVGLLGEIRLNAMAKALPGVEERWIYAPPITWPHYRMFQLAVARVALFTAEYLELRGLTANAYTAGLLHDLGRLLLLRLYPYAFQAMVAYARREAVPLPEAERRYLDCTTRAMGEYFARKHGLPRIYRNVIHWVETPGEAIEDVEMVGVVSLARHICRYHRVGYGGDAVGEAGPPIAEAAAWPLLQERVFPSFSLRKFDAEVHVFCADLRQTLTGHPRPVRLNPG
ncbi:MAG: HDOD domain-containing protein [Opitutaceae bacterium]|nr:HDOD domain-containing protein [Opitutaceae bacterium]